ncbi:MAG: hypothetical protein WBP58_08245 [Chitinophagaceae bacterium]
MLEVSLSHGRYGEGIISVMLISVFFAFVLYFILNGGRLLAFSIPVFLVSLVFFFSMIYFRRGDFKRRPLRLFVKDDILHCNRKMFDLSNVQIVLTLTAFRGEPLMSADGLLGLALNGHHFEIGNVSFEEADAVKAAIEELLARPIEIKASSIL